MKRIMDGNEACSYVSYKFSEVAGIYPITPASSMSELTDKWSNLGEKNYFNTSVKVVEMESEAGAIGMVHGALRNGMLSTTYTASQGLLLMLPNMYKIAGELLPGVINVASRTIATHALSIFGDHQDIYAARSTGWAMLASSSVQEVMDLTGVAHLSAIKSSVPFINFFDGFRTSHELQKVDVIDRDKLYKLIDKNKLNEFRKKAMNIHMPATYGSAQNGDIYFQNVEARNSYYDNTFDIVNSYMEEVNKITGKDYKPFNYYGSSKATLVIVAMGSVVETIKDTVDYLNKNGYNVGVVNVHLYRPFSSKYFLKAIPKSVKKIAVLDRCKEAGSYGEPLYLDVCKVLKELDIKVDVYGGRYGLSSKDTTPSMIKGVYDFINSTNAHSNFTVGIEDDVTNLSIKYDKFSLPSKKGDASILVYGYGSDGMVGASKDLLHITGENTNAYVQGYFQYDSKKSGGYTISHLRFSNNNIRSSYYVDEANLVVCTKDSYLNKLNMLDKIKDNGIFVINSRMDSDKILRMMSSHDKNILKIRKVSMYVIDANAIAEEANLSGKISTIMEAVIFKLGKIVPYDFAINKIKDSIKVKFDSKGSDIVEANLLVLDKVEKAIKEVKIPNVDFVKEYPKSKNYYDIIDSLEGDKLKVSDFINKADGVSEAGSSRRDKRNVSDMVPSWVSSNCINCNMCALVCPHAVIRPFLLDEKEVMDADDELVKKLIDIKLGDKTYKYAIGVSIEDCTGCGLCVEVCPGKRGIKALMMKMKEDIYKDKENISNKYLFEEVSYKENVTPNNTVRGSQFVKPKFEFSGACAGCGETPYLKLLTQLFGDRMIIANATGCSSIYGASNPSFPYSVPWANSLFEDNAEFGYGMKIADLAMKERIVNIINDNISLVKKSEKEIYLNYVNEQSIDNAKELLKIIDNSRIDEVKELKDFIIPKSVFMIGGDGWAYDIGFNGINHVLASGEDVNILVLDTEVYSNTGGQASKSSRRGAVAKFASNGKKNAKMNLAKIALTYDNVYVATISMGANPVHTIKILKEAEAYKGPSIVIAYSPCIAMGILKGMRSAITEEKDATSSGYFPLFHYNPENKEFKVDSKADFSKYEAFLNGEGRYKNLAKLNDKSSEILEKQKNDSMKDYLYYKKLEETE